MLQRAQDILRQAKTRMKTTLQVVADIAESVGLPESVTSVLQRGTESFDPRAFDSASMSRDAYSSGTSSAASSFDTRGTAASATQPSHTPTTHAPGNGHSAGTTPASSGNGASPTSNGKRTKKRPVAGKRELSAGIKALKVDDAINGSTYLARIIWTLGVAELEELGPLRPADIARMVMARSPVSLEPPNVARYIRRSNPSCIRVAHSEGSSNFYQLNSEGMELFQRNFGKQPD